jgi:hypothetical protein
VCAELRLVPMAENMPDCMKLSSKLTKPMIMKMMIMLNFDDSFIQSACF